MTTITMSFSPVGNISQTVAIIVSQTVDLIRTVIGNSQQEMSTVITTITKPSRTKIVVVESKAMDRELTIFQAIWEESSSWFVVLF